MTPRTNLRGGSVPVSTRPQAAIADFLAISVISPASNFFFFQAEDGIRDDLMTGVQTCALPIFIARHQHIVRVDRERRDPLRSETEGKLVRQIFPSLQKLDALVFSDYNKGLISDSFADRVLSRCHQIKVPVLVSPKASRLYAYRGARVVVCNIEEAGRFVTHLLVDDKSIEEAGRALLAHFGCSAMVITRGRKGMSVFDESSPRHLHVPATSFEVTYARVGQAGVERGATGRQVFDVTGAGDTVLSVLALAVAAGAPLADAAMLANTAAGVVVGQLGTASVRPQELVHALDEIGR